MKNSNLHHWTKNDYKIIFFITKYNMNPIYFKNESEVSEFIGTTITSVKKMCSNFRHLLGLPNQLNHIKKLQQEVFDECNGKGFMELLLECRTIVDSKVNDMILLSKGVKKYQSIGIRELV